MGRWMRLMRRQWQSQSCLLRTWTREHECVRVPGNGTPHAVYAFLSIYSVSLHTRKKKREENTRSEYLWAPDEFRSTTMAAQHRRHANETTTEQKSRTKRWKIKLKNDKSREKERHTEMEMAKARMRKGKGKERDRKWNKRIDRDNKRFCLSVVNNIIAICEPKPLPL